MKNWKEEVDNRVAFIRKCLANAGATAIIYGNSGGKDCSLVSILCKKACDNTIGVMMPCHSKRNYVADIEDAGLVAKQFGIRQIKVDLTPVRAALVAQIVDSGTMTPAALSNIAPRLRMTTLYAIGQTNNALVAGTGNASEGYMGYFTKWGDGAYDFNPIADLSVTEIYAFLSYLGAPQSIIDKKPSAGLTDGQTDEDDMGVTYAEIDKYMAGEEINPHSVEIIEKYHNRSHHKRSMPICYKSEENR